jgi:hypothetical protein
MDSVQNRQCAFKDVLGLETCFGLKSTVESLVARIGEHRPRGRSHTPTIAWVAAFHQSGFPSAR